MATSMKNAAEYLRIHKDSGTARLALEEDYRTVIDKYESGCRENFIVVAYRQYMNMYLAIINMDPLEL